MENLQVEKRGDTMILKVNRPHALNALNTETLNELWHFLTMEVLEQGVKALIFTGSGSKAFIAGADIKEMSAMDSRQMLQFCQLGQQVANALENAPFLTLAAVNGYALGGGLEMALACDFIYAAKSAKVGLPEVTLGIIPGFGGTQRLSRAVGTRFAKELIMSGRVITAEMAHEMGMINRVCSDDSLLAECLGVAEAITKNAQKAVIQTKSAINAGYGLPLAEALELERNMCAMCFATPEREDRMNAFVNKSTLK